MADNTSASILESMEHSGEELTSNTQFNTISEVAKQVPLPDDLPCNDRQKNLINLHEATKHFLNQASDKDKIDNNNTQHNISNNDDIEVSNNDKNKWIQVSRKRAAKNTSATTPAPTNTKNSFAVLGNDNPDAKKVKVAPKVYPIDIILTKELPYSELYKKFKSSLEYRPTVYNIGRDLVRVNACCATDYQKLLKLVKEENIQHTFTSSGVERKPIKVVIRGLSGTTDPEVLKEDIESLGYNVESVAQLKSMRKKKAPLPLFLASIIEDGQSSIKDEKFLMCGRVTIESYRTPALPRQCFKCQRFDHVSRNCQALTRCVKCGESHQSKDCSVTEKEKFACANCKENHTANYRGCADYKKAKKRITKKRPRTRKVTHQRPSDTPKSMVDPNKSYVSVTKSQMVPKNNTKKAATPSNGKPIPAAKPTASPAKAASQASTPAAKNSHEPQSIVNEYMQLLDEAADFANQSWSGEVPLQLAAIKAGQMIKKLTALGLRGAQQHG